jgi:hypothetical protein
MVAGATVTLRPLGRGRGDLAVPALALAFALALALAAPGAARAQALAARDTALVPPRGSYSVGVMNPLRIVVRDRLEIESHALVLFVAPNARVRIPHVDRGDRLRLTGEYGLSVPTLAMKLLQGHLFPSWHYEDQRVGWIVAPRAGAVASIGDPEGTAVVTFRADLTVGLPLTHTDTTPLDTYAPLELLFAPVTSGYRGRAGAAYDRRLAPRWRVRGYADLYLHGSGELHDPGQWPLSSAPRITTRVGAGVDVAPGKQMKNRLTVGVAWWSYSQHEIDPDTFAPRRSHDVFPTIDFIWSD